MLRRRIYVAELRALGLFYITVIKPLWDIIRGVENIFETNAPLHQLQTKLNEWKEDASPVLHGDSPFTTDMTDDISQKLLEDG